MKRGRPPKAPEERRDQVLRFRASVAEADLVYSLAVRAGLSVSDFLRAHLAPVLHGVSVANKSSAA